MQATGTIDKANPSLKLAPNPFSCATIPEFRSHNMGLSRALRGPVVPAILTASADAATPINAATGALWRLGGCLAPSPEL